MSFDDATQPPIRAFPEQIKAASAAYQAIVVIRDNFISHKSAKVMDAAVKRGIYWVYLPAYFPDLNPEEYLWKSMTQELSKDFIKNY